jgi:transmembrane sensor
MTRDRDSMPDPRSSSFDVRAADQQAADWLARRDRGLTAAEQDDYLQWLARDARHASLIARHEATDRRMQQLARWQPASSTEPNPDLFARPRRGGWQRAAALTAIAAALVFGTVLWQRSGREAMRPTTNFLRVNEREALADGSVVELREGSRIELAFSASERRVRLVGGEAYFTVAKDPSRPFIVEAGGVAVRAVGTVFAVRLDAATVDVLVTEGQVRVEPPVNASRPAADSSATRDVAASHRAVVSLAASAPPAEVTAVTPEQIKDALGWQAPRFQFYETPLAEAVEEFNHLNHHQLILGDPSLGLKRIGGTFRADNVEGFVSLLNLTMGIRGEARGADATVLLPAP